jgi:HAD superfamily hydrolase (TIGR01484 family)
MPRIKLVSFDVDGTLARPDKPVNPEVADGLRKLERKGVRIVLNSGKHAYYLWGFARGIGIENPLIIGENGCVFLDPRMKKEEIFEKRTAEISIIEKKIKEKFSENVWMPSNEVALTVFPRDVEIREVASYVGELLSPFREKVFMIEHKDAIDILPAGASKGKALAKVMESLGIKKDESAAVGDHESDIPMLEVVGFPIVFKNKKIFEKVKHKNENTKYFSEMKDVLKFLEGMV